MHERVRSSKIEQIFAEFAHHEFMADSDFYFDAADDVIYYDASRLSTNLGALSLLHEIAHAELAHFDFRTDLELFAMETQAWAKTRELAQRHGIACSDRYIRSCLNTYSRWIDQRSTCPTCDNFSLQTDSSTYQCFSCQARWRIQETANTSIRRVRLDN